MHCPPVLRLYVTPIYAFVALLRLIDQPYPALILGKCVYIILHVCKMKLSIRSNYCLTHKAHTFFLKRLAHTLFYIIFLQVKKIHQRSSTCTVCGDHPNLTEDTFMMFDYDSFVESSNPSKVSTYLFS